MKSYIVDLKHGIWRGEVWLESSNDEKALEMSLKEIENTVSSPMHFSDYFDKAVSILEKNGFYRVAK